MPSTLRQSENNSMIIVLDIYILLACIPAAMYCSFFERISSFSPEAREVAFLPYNSHFIVAVLSPILFIVMIVMSVLMMVLKNKWAAYIGAIITIPVSSHMIYCTVLSIINWDIGIMSYKCR